MFTKVSRGLEKPAVSYFYSFQFYLRGQNIAQAYV